MKNSFTPRPWKAVHIGEGGIPGEAVAVYEICTESGRRIATIAGENAHLIAAAPDLLAALEQLVEHVTSDGAIGNGESPVVNARAALAKANP